MTCPFPSTSCSSTTLENIWTSLIDLFCTLFQKLVITPVKKELGLAFKGNQRMVVEALEVIDVVVFLLVCV